MPQREPRVGVGVLVLDSGHVLLGLRKGAHGAGTWAPPGGHLEFGESIAACAEREVLEETGLEIRNVRYGPYTETVFASEELHYVTVFVLAEREAGEPRVLEPGKCERWAWFAWNALPRPLFEPLGDLVARGFRPR